MDTGKWKRAESKSERTRMDSFRSGLLVPDEMYTNEFSGTIEHPFRMDQQQIL